MYGTVFNTSAIVLQTCQQMWMSARLVFTDASIPVITSLAATPVRVTLALPWNRTA